MSGANEPQYTLARLLEEGPDQEAVGRATAWSGQKLIIVIGLGVIGLVCLASAVIAEKGMSLFSGRVVNVSSLQSGEICQRDGECTTDACAKWGWINFNPYSQTGTNDPVYHCCPCPTCVFMDDHLVYWCSDLEASTPCRYHKQCSSSTSDGSCRAVGSCAPTCQPFPYVPGSTPKGYVKFDGVGLCRNATAQPPRNLTLTMTYEVSFKDCADQCSARDTCYGFSGPLFSKKDQCILWTERGLQGGGDDSELVSCFVKEQNQECPLKCFAPHCVDGPQRYGGTNLSRMFSGQRVCIERCARRNTSTSYMCGRGTSYFEAVEDSVDCASCVDPASGSSIIVHNFKFLLASGMLHRQFAKVNLTVRREICSRDGRISKVTCDCDAYEDGANETDLVSCMSTCLPNASKWCQNSNKTICFPRSTCDAPARRTLGKGPFGPPGPFPSEMDEKMQMYYFGTGPENPGILGKKAYVDSFSELQDSLNEMENDGAVDVTARGSINKILEDVNSGDITIRSGELNNDMTFTQLSVRARDESARGYSRIDFVEGDEEGGVQIMKSSLRVSTGSTEIERLPRSPSDSSSEISEADMTLYRRIMGPATQAADSGAPAMAEDLIELGGASWGEMAFNFLGGVCALGGVVFEIWQLYDFLAPFFRTPDPYINCATREMMLGEPNFEKRMELYNACYGGTNQIKCTGETATCTSYCPMPDGLCGYDIPCCPARVTVPAYSQILSQLANEKEVRSEGGTRATWEATCEHGMKAQYKDDDQYCVTSDQVLNTKPAALAWRLFSGTESETSCLTQRTHPHVENLCNTRYDDGCVRFSNGTAVCPKPPCFTKNDIHEVIPAYLKPMQYKCPSREMFLATPWHLREWVWATKQQLPSALSEGGCQFLNDDCDQADFPWDVKDGCFVKRAVTYVPTSFAPCKPFKSANASASIMPGFGLAPGAQLMSEELRLVMRKDGILMLERTNGTKLWSINSVTGSHLAMYNNTYVAIYNGQCTYENNVGKRLVQWSMDPQKDPKPDDFIKLSLNDTAGSLELLVGRYDNDASEHVNWHVQWSSDGGYGTGLVTLQD